MWSLLKPIIHKKTKEVRGETCGKISRQVDALPADAERAQGCLPYADCSIPS